MRVGGEEDMRGDPVGGLPVPIGVGGADEFGEVWTPLGERDGEARGGGGEVVFFDEGRGVAQLELVELRAVRGEELREAAACVREICGEDREVREEGHFPRRQDGEGDVVEGYFQGAQGGECDDHARQQRIEVLRGWEVEVGGRELEVLQRRRGALQHGADMERERRVVVVISPRQPLQLILRMRERLEHLLGRAPRVGRLVVPVPPHRVEIGVHD